MSESQLLATAQVVESSPDSIEFSIPTACQSCRSCISWLAALNPSQRHLVLAISKAENGKPMPSPGDAVQLALPAPALMILSALVYGVPLFSLLVCMWIAGALLPRNDFAAILGAVTGLSVGIAIAWAWLRRNEHGYAGRLQWRL